MDHQKLEKQFLNEVKTIDVSFADLTGLIYDIMTGDTFGDLKSGFEHLKTEDSVQNIANFLDDYKSDIAEGFGNSPPEITKQNAINAINQLKDFLINEKLD